MGLKDWLAANVAGASGYGNAMGRQTVENGLALGRVLYLGHGTRSSPGGSTVFENSAEMEAAGFTLYCPDPLNRPPMEDSSELSRQARAAGVALATQCAITAAYNFMKDKNATAFSRSLGESTRIELQRLDSPVTADLILRYLKLPRPTAAIRVVNLEQPGTDDILSVFLKELARSGSGTVSFQRRGVLGFDLIVVPLAQETVKVISEATQKFSW